MHQRQFIHEYSRNNRDKFNEQFFIRDDMVLVETMKKLILSLSRDSYFTLRVENFTLVTQYSEIMTILREYEERRISKKKKKKDIQNKYENISLQNSDVMLLIVDYFIQVNDGKKNPHDTLRVYILLPRIVDKYYYRINGILYSAIYQIVDGSTYNNSIYNSKVPINTLKSIFMPARVNRYLRNLVTIDGETITATLYSICVFKKVCMCMEYILARYGYQGTLDYFNLNGLIHVSKVCPTNFDDCYVFEKNGVYISTPKEIFKQDKIIQSFISTLDLHLSLKKGCREKLFSQDYWLISLSSQFSSKPSISKGLSILDSFENIYDECIHSDLKLPPEKKRHMYDILKWIMCEFDELLKRDVIDTATKKIRREEYIASIYTSKVVLGIYRSSDIQDSVTVDQIKRWINTEPDFLLNRLTSDRLVNFRNASNDLDSLVALKYSYKGISGLGENKGSSIPEIFKQLDYSSLGRTDPDSSSATDPGITGLLCPLNYEMDGNYFSNYREPNSWDEDFEALKEAYLKTSNKLCAMRKINSDSNNLNNILDDTIDLLSQAMNNIVYTDSQDEYVEGMTINV